MGKTIGPGQIQVVSGIDVGSVLFGGGIEFVTSGGNAIDTMINAGGNQFVQSGGKAGYATVNLGGVQTVGASGEANSTEVNPGGLQIVAHGGKTDFAIINGGSQYLKGVSYFTEVMNGGTETVADFGHALYTTVDAGSLQDVQDAAHADFTRIRSGGKQIVESGGIVNYTEVDGGGLEVVMDSGRADYTTVAATGVQDVFGWTNYASVYGVQEIENGGVDLYTNIYGGGAQLVLQGGSANGDTVHQGAAQYVAGDAGYSWVYGYQKVAQPGHADHTDIFSGGQQVVDGVAISSEIGSGGLMVVEAGGAANHTGIDAGGTERVLNGGHELDVRFWGAGLLDLDDANSVGAIEGWRAGAGIDLRDIAFGADTTFGYNAQSGILSITDGHHSSSLHFMDQQFVGNFSLSPDGHGGTLITDPVGKA